MRVSAINGALAWAIVSQYLTTQSTFSSITGLLYQATVENDTVCFAGGNRKDFESMSRLDFVATFDAIKSLSIINTNTIKHYMAKDIYAKRTPFIGLLWSAGIIS